MWQEAKANDKRIRELMVDHKKRAERRRAYYESRLGDPLQLIRVIGSASKLYPDAEQFYYHENTDNFMPWQANPDIKIDRFDGRSLLDYMPTTSKHQDNKEDDMTDELNFERYHDLIEAERLNVSEKERLAEVEEEWTKLLDRHQAKLNMIRQQEKSSHRSGHYGFDYGTRKVTTEETDSSQLLKQEDILQHVDDLTDQDKQVLNAMSSKYGIRSYARLLRVAKKDRDDELRSLKRKQQEGKPKSEKSEQRKRRRRKRRRHRGESDEDDFGRMDRSGRHSPSYEPYHQGSDSNSSSSSSSDYTDDEDHKKTSQSHDVSDDVVIEFGSSVPEEQTQESDPSHIHSPSTASTLSTVATETTEKKLTPMEKLKLKMRQGLQKQIVSDEKDRRKKENEKEIEHLQALARNQGLPIHTYLRPEPPRRKQAEPSQERYRSPSSSDNDNQQTKERTRYRSPSPDKDRKRYRSPSEDRNRKRYRSPSSSSSDNRRRRHRSSSRRHSSSRRRSSSRHRSKRYRSPSSSPDRSHKSRHHHKSSHRHHRHSYSHKR
ncbi:alternative splicing regulator-domain-containing protein [Choanephora cucurbitarum]|nr:alternative splicing regulator-domain-containing protein [Choanephora cucurbitarum]